jgi:hypothetical protein
MVSFLKSFLPKYFYLLLKQEVLLNKMEEENRPRQEDKIEKEGKHVFQSKVISCMKQKIIFVLSL